MTRIAIAGVVHETNIVLIRWEAVPQIRCEPIAWGDL